MLYGGTVRNGIYHMCDSWEMGEDGVWFGLFVFLLLFSLRLSTAVMVWEFFFASDDDTHGWECVLGLP